MKEQLAQRPQGRLRFSALGLALLVAVTTVTIVAAAPASQAASDACANGHLTARMKRVCKNVRTYHKPGEIQCYNPASTDGGHSTGKACDFFPIRAGKDATKDSDALQKGDTIATYARNIHPETEKIDYIIWRGKICNPSRDNGCDIISKWRKYTGASPHKDHVHVKVK